METCSNGQERPEVSAEERRLCDLTKKIRKLRWIGSKVKGEDIKPQCGDDGLRLAQEILDNWRAALDANRSLRVDWTHGAKKGASTGE